MRVSNTDGLIVLVLVVLNVLLTYFNSSLISEWRMQKVLQYMELEKQNLSVSLSQDPTGKATLLNSRAPSEEEEWLWRPELIKIKKKNKNNPAFSANQSLPLFDRKLPPFQEEQPRICVLIPTHAHQAPALVANIFSLLASDYPNISIFVVPRDKASISNLSLVVRVLNRQLPSNVINLFRFNLPNYYATSGVDLSYLYYDMALDELSLPFPNRFGCSYVMLTMPSTLYHRRFLTEAAPHIKAGSSLITSHIVDFQQRGHRQMVRAGKDSEVLIRYEVSKTSLRSLLIRIEALEGRRFAADVIDNMAAWFGGHTSKSPEEDFTMPLTTKGRKVVMPNALVYEID
eukprot:TRINITY_DN1750_c1_g1_i1.p1 TRINITY_DN1750_c1_g1~~TRINITY_DN1750_c1_g1_i1.p1  ORF type:complete len:344 (-),score=70.41 TRINITY_DN1750_c1_g1_i1:153-1184(-)